MQIVFAAIFLLVAASTTSATAAIAGPGPRRGLRVSIDSAAANALPVTEGLAKGADISSPDLPAHHPRLAARAAGIAQCEPEQVHLTYWTSTSVLVSFASCAAMLNTTRARSTAGVLSAVFWGASPDTLDRRAEGVATAYAIDYSSRGGVSYSSPLLHHVLLRNLTPGSTIFYAPATNAGDSKADLSQAPRGARVYKFTLPKAGAFPLRIGIVGDPGQTAASAATLDRLIASQPDLVMVAGDFSYADRFRTQDEYVLAAEGVTFQPKWDSWGRLFEPLLSKRPMLHTSGNHEIEQTPSGDRHTAYNARYPTPYAAGHDTSKGPSSFAPVSQKADPWANLFYAVEMRGAFKFISLTSYAAGQTFDHQERQYQWLKAELAKVDRQRTPWVIVSLHGPFYHTYTSHWKELECMRQAYEPLLVAGGVDFVISGHTHAYERIKPVVDYKLSATCGPQYLVVGDGGNVEGLAHEFIDVKQPALCQNPHNHTTKLFPSRYQPQTCFSFQAGSFCPSKQPEWSAHRTAGFGFGSLELLSPTQARFSWTHLPGATKGEEASWRVADSVTVTRDDSRRGCPKLSDLMA